MPETEQILQGLAAIANDHIPFAIGWHLVLTAVGLALWAGWRPSNRWTGVLIAGPMASVSAFAWTAHNPFNGSTFALLSVLLVALGLRGNRDPASPGESWARGLGAAMIAFGWIYPHFLAGRPAVHYTLAAPLGLIPCPTLSVAIGLALLASGLRNRAWSLTLAGAGLLYAVFGVLRLGVWLDLPLLIGAVGLAAVAARPREKSARQGRRTQSLRRGTLLARKSSSPSQ